MDERYQQFNEMTFEAYVKSAVEKAVRKARKRRAVRGQWEQSFSTLTDAELYSVSREDTQIKQIEQDDQLGRLFHVQGKDISVNAEKLGRALSFLTTRDREIVLMYYYLKMKDEKISHIVGLSRSTVQRRRNNAIKRLHALLEADK